LIASQLRFRFIMATLALLLLPVVGEAQVDPDVLRQLAAQLGGKGSSDQRLEEALKQFGASGKIDPKLVSDIQRMMQQNPDAFKSLIDRHPALPPQQREEFLQKIKPNGNKLPDIHEPKWPERVPGGPQSKGPEYRQPHTPPRPPANRELPTDLPDNKDYQSLAQMWEQTLGPLSETPAVRDALIEAFKNGGMDNLGKSSGWKDLFDGSSSSSGAPSGRSRMFDWLKNSGSGMNWKWPSFGGSSSSSSWSAPRSSGSFSSGMSAPSADGLGNVGMVLICLLVVGAIAVICWRYWPADEKAGGKDAWYGMTGWAFDPRGVSDRESVVKAFECLSLTETAGEARVWNHLTIAAVLREHHPEVDGIAEPLARLYAIARYSPIAEPMSPADISEARHHLCSLAGVPV